MKIAKQIKIGNRTYTHFRCTECGKVTKVACALGTKTARQAMTRQCSGCHNWSRPTGTVGWWAAFGLTKNPYVYGPMPRRRTGEFWRRAEARVRGWLAHYWTDEYSEQRRALWQL